MLTQIQAPLVSVAADSAYDKEAVYEAIEAHSPGRRTRVVIPPQLRRPTTVEGQRRDQTSIAAKTQVGLLLLPMNV